MADYAPEKDCALGTWPNRRAFAIAALSELPFELRAFAGHEMETIGHDVWLMRSGYFSKELDDGSVAIYWNEDLANAEDSAAAVFVSKQAAATQLRKELYAATRS